MLGQIINNSRDVLAFIVLFGFTIFIHELGHFIMALRCGMVVDTFSIGFGPAIWKRKIRGVVYKIAWIPFGGYVALPQLDPSGMATIQGTGVGGETAEVGGLGAGKGQGTPDQEQQAEAPRNLPPVAAWKKILVSLSGCVGNMAFAVLLAWVIYLSPAVKSKEMSTQIGHVFTNSVAYQAGLRAGDEIVAVNGVKVSSWYDYSVECQLGGGDDKEIELTVRSNDGQKLVRLPVKESLLGIQAVDGVEKAMRCVVTGLMEGSAAEEAGIKAGDVILDFNGTPVAGSQHFIRLTGENGDQTVSLTVERDGQPVVLSVTPRFNATHGRPMIGVVFQPQDTYVAAWMMYTRPWDQIRSDMSGIARILRALVTPRESKQAAKGLGGPLLIFMALWAAIQTSFLNAIGFVRFLNVNLAILNLLPIPVLDGGHIVFSLWEGITRRRVHPTVVNVLINVFAVLLIGVMLLITYRDVLRWKLIRGLERKLEIEERATNAAPAGAGSETNSQAAGTQKTGE